MPSDDEFIENPTYSNDKVMDNTENATHSDDDENELSADDSNEDEDEEEGGICSICKSIIFAGEKEFIN